MKYYVQYKTLDLANELTDVAGSDGIFILDGRNKIPTMIDDAYNQMNRMRNIHPSWEFFEIHKGDLRNSRIIYQNY